MPQRRRGREFNFEPPDHESFPRPPAALRNRVFACSHTLSGGVKTQILATCEVLKEIRAPGVARQPLRMTLSTHPANARYSRCPMTNAHPAAMPRHHDRRGVEASVLRSSFRRLRRFGRLRTCFGPVAALTLNSGGGSCGGIFDTSGIPGSIPPPSHPVRPSTAKRRTPIPFPKFLFITGLRKVKINNVTPISLALAQGIARDCKSPPTWVRLDSLARKPLTRKNAPSRSTPNRRWRKALSRKARGLSRFSHRACPRARVQHGHPENRRHFVNDA